MLYRVQYSSSHYHSTHLSLYIFIYHLYLFPPNLPPLKGANDPRTLNPMLISPIADRMYCCLPEYVKRHLRCGVGELYEEGQYEKVGCKLCIIVNIVWQAKNVSV